MDKETLAILISALSEIEIIELYKIKKINNFGFRANTIDDVRKNRKILENNLLKPINVKHVQEHFVFKAANSEIKIDGLEWNELKELCENEGYSNVLISLYANSRKDDFKKLFTEYSEESNKNPIQSTRKDKGLDSVSEIKSNKTIKKLETKINNITEEFQKKEYNYKIEMENMNKLVAHTRRENTLLKQDINRISKENNLHKLEINTLTNENVKLKDLNDKLLQQNEISNNELQSLKEEMALLKEELNHLDNSTSISTNNQTDSTTTYEIAVFGEFNEYILSEIKGINFEFIESEAIKEFKKGNNFTKYNEIWIIHYDLTQKEKRLVQMMNFESNIKIEDIYNLKELNQAMVNLKNDRVI